MSEAKRVMENYHKAREIVAKEVAEKYGLVETYRNHEELKMESDNYVFNYRFIIPDCDELYIEEKGVTDSIGKSFKSIIFDNFPAEDKHLEVYRKVYAEISHRLESERFSALILQKKFLAKTKFLMQNFSFYFEMNGCEPQSLH